MYIGDRFTWPGYATRTRHVHWPWGRAARPRARVPYRRRLAAIERGLEGDSAALSAKFAVFNQLTDGEGPVGAERVPSAWPQVRPLHVATLLVLAAIVALCVTLSVQLRPEARACRLASAAAATAATAATGPSSTPYAQVHDQACPAYPAARQ